VHDTKGKEEIRGEKVRRKMQEALDTWWNRAKTWNMQFNLDKCKVSIWEEITLNMNTICMGQNWERQMRRRIWKFGSQNKIPKNSCKM
jgi:hypothetical protein